MALAKHRSCLSPTDQEESEVLASRPPHSTTRSQIFKRCNAETMTSSDTFSRGSMLNRMEPGIKKGSWGTTLMREGRSDGIRSWVSTPSIVTEPLKGIMWSRLRMKDVFPLPERPQIAIFSPLAMEMDTPFRTGSPPDLIPSVSRAQASRNYLLVRCYYVMEGDITSSRPVLRCRLRLLYS